MVLRSRLSRAFGVAIFLRYAFLFLAHGFFPFPQPSALTIIGERTYEKSNHRIFHFAPMIRKFCRLGLCISLFFERRYPRVRVSISGGSPSAATPAHEGIYDPTVSLFPPTFLDVDAERLNCDDSSDPQHLTLAVDCRSLALFFSARLLRSGSTSFQALRAVTLQFFSCFFSCSFPSSL